MNRLILTAVERLRAVIWVTAELNGNMERQTLNPQADDWRDLWKRERESEESLGGLQLPSPYYGRYDRYGTVSSSSCSALQNCTWSSLCSALGTCRQLRHSGPHTCARDMEAWSSIAEPERNAQKRSGEPLRYACMVGLKALKHAHRSAN
ncbi:hypothetical protein AAFF_G00158600 [Aldrovandia affinis]|uniref:Uncharacterized protein n=1 Tax=Aldrovandia affinis TaxID=143900 RepID=A0AAD7W802_9TELE|nr:hypothetical protein AAFF_G00158600 [Aldrovandia affinis]